MTLRKGIAAILACASLSACTPMLAGAGGLLDSAPVAAAADTVVLEGTRALIIAEYAYSAAANAALAATQAGLIRGDTATRVRMLNDKATAALIAGNRAQSAADKARHAATVLDAVADLRALIPAR